MRIQKLEKDIFERIGDNALFHFHIKRTIWYALRLAKHYHVNEEEVIAGALLHDIDGIVKKTKNDFVSSQKIAGEILKSHKYTKDFIQSIQGVILTHSSGSVVKPRTKLEQIVANADALSHFEMVPLYFYVRGLNKLSFAKALREVREKLAQSEKKLTLYEAKRLAKTLKLAAKKQLENY